MLYTERRVDHQGSSFPVKHQVVARQGIVKQGVVEGKHIKNILLDTGCLRTLVHQDLVPENKMKDGEAVAIRCAHGDTVLYPLAQVHMEVEGRQIEIEAAVSNTLPMGILLGTDTQELAELLVIGEKKAEGDAFMVSTRAVTRKQQSVKCSQGESACGVRPPSCRKNPTPAFDSCFSAIFLTS